MYEAICTAEMPTMMLAIASKKKTQIKHKHFCYIFFQYKLFVLFFFDIFIFFLFCGRARNVVLGLLATQIVPTCIIYSDIRKQFIIINDISMISYKHSITCSTTTNRISFLFFCFFYFFYFYFFLIYACIKNLHLSVIVSMPPIVSHKKNVGSRNTLPIATSQFSEEIQQINHCRTQLSATN